MRILLRKVMKDQFFLSITLFLLLAYESCSFVVPVASYWMRKSAKRLRLKEDERGSIFSTTSSYLQASPTASSLIGNETMIMNEKLVSVVDKALLDDLYVQPVEKDGKSGLVHIMARELCDASQEEIWQWWEDKKAVERVLKSAIASEEIDLRPYFNDYKRFLAMDKADVLQANEDFHRALSEGDANMMASLWLPCDDAVCLYPKDQNVWTGYSQIITGLRSAFESAAIHTYTLWRSKDIRLQYQGDMAVVTCESEEVSRATGRVFARYSTTSLFVRPHYTDRYLLQALVSTPIITDKTKVKKKENLKDTYRDPTVEKSQRGSAGGVMSLQQLLGNGMGASMEIIRGPGPGPVDDNDDDDDNDNDQSMDERLEIANVEAKCDDDDEDVGDIRKILQARIRNTLRQAMNKMVRI